MSLLFVMELLLMRCIRVQYIVVLLVYANHATFLCLLLLRHAIVILCTDGDGTSVLFENKLTLTMIGLVT